MKQLLLITALILSFIGCGSSDSNDTPPSLNLSDKLANNTYYVVKDNLYTKNYFTLAIDENATSWNMGIYESSSYTTEEFAAPQNIKLDNNYIRVENSGTFILVNTTQEYINFKLESSENTKFKFFTTKEDATSYANISLQESVKDKTFYTVQNNLEARSLISMKFNTDASAWDIAVHENNYEEENIVGTSANLNIITTDNNLTDSGGTVFGFNSYEEKYISLVFTANSDLQLKLYHTKEDALENFNSFDLRDELRNTTYYAVSVSNGVVTPMTLAFNDTLSSYDIVIYSDNFITENQSGSSEVTVKEDRFTDTGDSQLVSNTTDDYIEVQALNSTQVIRLYKTQEQAKSYYIELSE